MKVIKKKRKKKKKANNCSFTSGLLRFFDLFLALSFPPFSGHNRENNGTSLPSISDYFNFAQVPSRLAKRDEFPGGSRLVSFFIERFAYHGFCFAFCVLHLPNSRPPSRFPVPLCAHFSGDTIETQKVRGIVPYSIVFYI